MDKTDFPHKVKMIREKLSMSQEDLARALNISFATINRWENGKTYPNKMAQDVFYAFCFKNKIDIKSLVKRIDTEEVK